MYGFPRELHELSYPVSGDAALTAAVRDALGDDVRVSDDWGIDHGAWSVLVHMFPQADIPVVQLSVDGTAEHRRAYEIGRLLAPLRDEGCLILASGNVVHNLQRVDWEHPDAASTATLAFNVRIVRAVETRDDETVIGFERLPGAAYAAPTPDHFLPLLYTLGAGECGSAHVFNNVGVLGSLSMTGFVFEGDAGRARGYHDESRRKLFQVRNRALKRAPYLLFCGGSSGIRTLDLGIKSPLL